MALETPRTLVQLQKECSMLHIDVEIEGKEKKEHYVRALREYYLTKYFGDLENVPWAMQFMLSIDCPQLCKRYQQCKPSVQQMFWNSAEYVMEEKLDGVRCLILWDAAEQEFSFFSRNNSVKDFLPQNYKDTILVRDSGFTYPHNFVLDSECIATNPRTSTTNGSGGVQCETQLQSTTAILATDPIESRAIQLDHPLKFVVFDCLHHVDSMLDEPWTERRTAAVVLTELLQHAAPFIVELNRVYTEEKQEVYTDLIEQQKEGVVFKKKTAVYHATTSRTNDQVKLKRSISDSLEQDVDAWVTGYTKSSEDKMFGDRIGALEFSCMLQRMDGTITEHVIGVCSGLPYDVRSRATVLVDGVPTLNPEFLGRVATISGQNISARKLSLMHAILLAWRPDKNPDGCEILKESELKALIF